MNFFLRMAWINHVGHMIIVLFSIRRISAVSTRPYFRSSIDDLESIFRSAQSDLSVLRKPQQELAHREKVRKRLEYLTGQSSNTDYSHAMPPSAVPVRQVVPPRTSFLPHESGTHSAPPERLVVECALCKTPNFVNTLNGIVPALHAEHHSRLNLSMALCVQRSSLQMNRSPLA